MVLNASNTEKDMKHIVSRGGHSLTAMLVVAPGDRLGRLRW